MTRDEATTELARHADALRARGAEAAYLFGSTARGESRDDSDLDVFIDVAPGRKFSLTTSALLISFFWASGRCESPAVFVSAFSDRNTTSASSLELPCSSLL